MTRHDQDIVNLIFQTDLQAFVHQCFRTLNPATPFLSNWHIQALAWHLHLVRIGKIRRLIIRRRARLSRSPVRSRFRPLSSATIPAHA